jgi:hypothetical protein
MQDSAEVRVMQGARKEAYWDMVSRRMDAEAAKRGVDTKGQGYEVAKNMIDQQRKAAKLQNDRLAMQAALAEAEKRRQERRADAKWSIEQGQVTAKESSGDTNIVETAAPYKAFVEGRAPVVAGKDGKPTLLPMPVVQKGGMDSLMDKHPETFLKVNKGIASYGTALDAFDRINELNRMSLAGVNLSASDRKERAQLVEHVAMVTKSAGESSDADKIAREIANTPDAWADAKAVANQRARLENHLLSALPGQKYIDLAKNNYEKIKKNKVR